MSVSQTFKPEGCYDLKSFCIQDANSMNSQIGYLEMQVVVVVTEALVVLRQVSLLQYL